MIKLSVELNLRIEIVFFCFMVDISFGDYIGIKCLCKFMSVFNWERMLGILCSVI